MFAMDYSGRINDDIDDGTTDGFLWRDRDPEVFFDSYSTRKWICDLKHLHQPYVEFYQHRY